MRAALSVFFAVAVLPVALAHAQVTVQDQADTFLSDRQSHQAKMDTNAQKWWGGDMADPNGGAIGYNYENPGMGMNMVPGNPLTVEPLFSYEDMLNADTESNPPPPEAIPVGNPSENPEGGPVNDLEDMGRELLGSASDIIGSFGDEPAPETTAAADQIPSAPPPADIGAPPVQDELGAEMLDPADATETPGLTDTEADSETLNSG
ncbi:MAG: hypothetical protein KKA05_03570, partial [Alphaproteobacteria bacterium]|nr:hypothetical protein [Alphaproteobacteria bacterium]